MYKIFILFIYLSISVFSETIDLENKDLNIKIIKPEQTIKKTKKDYEKDEDSVLKKGVKPLEQSEKKKKNNLEFGGNVNIDDENKTIEGVNVNVGTKF